MSKTAENQKLLSEQQLDSLSYPEPPSDFADRVMSALLAPKVEPKPKPRSLLWLGVSAATFALGVASSPLLLRAPGVQSSQLQAVTQPTKMIATPNGGPSMIPVKTTLGAISILGAFLGGIGPAVEPDAKQTKQFCKDVVASCEENPTEVCEKIWGFCQETPVGSKKTTVIIKRTFTIGEEAALDQQQAELDEQQAVLDEQQAAF